MAWAQACPGGGCACTAAIRAPSLHVATQLLGNRIPSVDRRPHGADAVVLRAGHTDTMTSTSTTRWMAVDDDGITTTSDMVGLVPPSRSSSTATCWHGEGARGAGSGSLP
ncbi:hypothetical protein C2845_PM03G24870 [Panicum miliaceum]|uniref:Uncharacterized protein n=1 Tax=Panicum miliaceum TaxID=4540 RepID=A0A3L6TDB0_PANMI|nr:hypothetical protein C2845_PM03G24870 [Panicum miliaceum]